MFAFLQVALLAVFLVPLVLDRRARRRGPLDPSRMPVADRPPAAAAGGLPRPWARRRYAVAGVDEVAAYLREQDTAR
ncbi:hypothetical protein [Kineococcus indalonis]|uniref:hypothetical protein n=1 Tax=Kineococcus indalonis TaxID=2696566 RepID=UPI00141238EE|nr:hypothetical protein [Kineococcus indalonis]NAZ86793.1 hypothetical protein [Kineococcus indalonis]